MNKRISTSLATLANDIFIRRRMQRQYHILKRQYFISVKQQTQQQLLIGRGGSGVCATSCCRRFPLSTFTRATRTGPGESAESSAEDAEPSQPFVQTRLVAGEWDPETRTNPLYRPRYKSRAKIISAEDFANSPTVGFTNQLESLQDAMMTLSWFDQSEQKQIYHLYQEFTKLAHQKYGRSSHEYIMRVIAQRYNITAQRVASIVELQYNEEQLMQDPENEAWLLSEEADYMDDAIKQEIHDAYETFRLKKPDTFVEDPVGVTGEQESKWYTEMEDLLDVDKMTQESIVREEQRARLAIDGHVYTEDIDEDKIEIHMSKDCQDMLAAHEKHQKQAKDAASKSLKQTAASAETNITPLPTEPQVVKTSPQEFHRVDRRPRWKYMAQVVNTRDLKKKKKEQQRRKQQKKKTVTAVSSGYTNDSPFNTLVEEEDVETGERILRAATLEDVRKTAWKPVKHVQEFTYKTAKRGWLDRMVRGQEEAWGSQALSTLPLKAAVESTTKAQKKGNKKASTVVIGKKGVAGESSSSSSSDDDSGSSSDD